MSQMEPMPPKREYKSEKKEEHEWTEEATEEYLRHMNERETEPENEFKLKFQGRLNEVDASTLGYSLVNVTSVIREINDDLGVARIDIKVKSTAPGSFIVHLALQALTDPIFQASIAQAGTIGATIIKTLVDLLNLRKALKGEPPKEIVREVDEIKVKTGDNSTVSIDNRTFTLYFTEPTVNDALSKVFKTLESDKSIEGFEVTDAEERHYLRRPAKTSAQWH